MKGQFIRAVKINKEGHNMLLHYSDYSFILCLHTCVKFISFYCRINVPGEQAVNLCLHCPPSKCNSMDPMAHSLKVLITMTYVE